MCVCVHRGCLSFLSQGPGLTLSSLCFHLLASLQLMSLCFLVQSDISSRTQDGGVAMAGQDVGPEAGYLGTRAKLCSELLPEGHDLLGSGVDPHQEQRRYASEEWRVSASSAGFYL